MEVVCINNSLNEIENKIDLTIGKIYNAEICKNLKYYYILIDDLGVSSIYLIDRFITLAEFRNQRINEILE
jgi:hypothetical protein